MPHIELLYIYGFYFGLWDTISYIEGYLVYSYRWDVHIIFDSLNEIWERNVTHVTGWNRWGMIADGHGHQKWQMILSLYSIFTMEWNGWLFVERNRIWLYVIDWTWMSFQKMFYLMNYEWDTNNNSKRYRIIDL